MASISEIIRKVKVILDENENITNGFLAANNTIEDPDQLQTDDIIRTLIPIAVDKVHKAASIDMLDDVITTLGSSSGSGGSLYWSSFDKYCSKANLPSDFIKIAYVKLSGWKRGAVDVLDEISPKYAEFFSDLAGVRPSTIYPAVAVVSGDRGLEVVACPRTSESGGYGGVIRYVAKANESGDSINVASKCYNALLYCIAYLYYVTINEKQRAEMMAKECVELLNISQQKLVDA